MRDLIGRTLGHYRIVEKIGEGGMGEVYRAHDERLDRDVAVKVLPEAVAEDEGRLARFEREARLLASLNHPNIATLYGLEEYEGRRFLVMELAEGETLAERLKKGSIPVDDALQIALQIAEGLEAAHEHGIIHRDLKPANVMLSAEGKVKILDFGLAKAWHPEGGDADLTHSPTLTAQMTRAGVLLGTAAYMSPEQARGKAADKRSDIWAFGVMIFEMLTGTRLFRGETTSDVLAAVLQAEPDWSELPVETPKPIRRLLCRSLERDLRERLHDIADARIEIEEAIARPSRAAMGHAEPLEPTYRDMLRASWPVMLAALIIGGLLAGSISWKIFGASRSAHGSPVRLTLSLPPGVTIESSGRPQLAISPDDAWLVFAASNGHTQQLFKRSLEQFDAVPIPGTEGGFNPFFSSDKRWVGFFSGGKLKKISMDGGPPQILADAPNPWGGTWGSDHTIVFNRQEVEGLWRVPDTGGAPELLAPLQPDLGDRYLLYPEFLADGTAVLFTAFRGMTADTARIEILDVISRARTVLIENASSARFVPTGHLIFGQKGVIHAAPFDTRRCRMSGPSVPLPDPIFYEIDLGVTQFVCSAKGTLAFIPGSGPPKRRLVSVDLAGVEKPLIEGQRSYMYPKLSPDGERLAVTVWDSGDINIWVIDLVTGAHTKLTREGANFYPSWTPDGKRVTYLCIRGRNESSIEWMQADGSGESEPLILPEEDGEKLGPCSWSPDGRWLAFRRYVPSKPEHQNDIWVAARDRDRGSHPLVATDANEHSPAFSPDGQWLAYVSAVSGRWEIYVQPFPGGGERHQISADGGWKPVWSPDGHDIFFRTPDNDQKILRVEVSTSPQFRAGAPQVLFDGQFALGTYYLYPNFDIAPDGKSFVMIKPDEKWGKATDIRVVLNWFEELKRLAPTE